MSLAPNEFVASCERLAGANDHVSESRVELGVGDGQVVITYEPLEGVRLGGLLDLPRAKVTITFDGVDPTEQEKFLRRFEVTFQRGGG